MFSQPQKKGRRAVSNLRSGQGGASPYEGRDGRDSKYKRIKLAQTVSTGRIQEKHTLWGSTAGPDGAVGFFAVTASTGTVEKRATETELAKKLA